MTRRSLFLLFATVLMLSATVITTPVSAEEEIRTCCFTITNSMRCTMTFCFDTPIGPACVTVQPGSTVTTTLPVACDVPQVYVTDACGNRRSIPANGCTIANLGSCCPRICLQRDVTRCWQITTAPSPLCYSCIPDID